MAAASTKYASKKTSRQGDHGILIGDLIQNSAHGWLSYCLRQTVEGRVFEKAFMEEITTYITKLVSDHRDWAVVIIGISAFLDTVCLVDLIFPATLIFIAIGSLLATQLLAPRAPRCIRACGRYHWRYGIQRG